VSAAAILARLTAAGYRVSLRPDGRVSLRPAPPPDLLAEARQHRDELARLVAATTQAGTVTPSAEATPPEAEAPPAQRQTRPGALRGDPPAPVVDPDASRCLCIMELAGAAPRLTPDGRLELAHPERVTAAERATALQHGTDIAALLRYRDLMEQLFQVTAEPMPPEDTP
jgi:hypothetical protein